MKYKIADIAKMANVSPATVSRVLNGQQGVNPTTREEVKAIIDEIGYRPNSIARSLARGHSDIVALVIDDIRNPYYATLVYNIQEALAEHGYMVIITSHENNIEKNLNFFHLAEQFEFAGVILTTALEDEELAKRIKAMKCPTVLLNRTMTSFAGDYVIQDNYIAGYQMTKHLIEYGYSEIAVLRGPLTSSSSVQRYNGYCHAMNSFGLPIEEKWILSGNLRMERGYEAGKWYAQHLDEMPKAIVAGNDMMAIGFMDAFLESGLSVPEDISIGSFDDIEIARTHMIGLTTMKEPLEEMTKIAAKFLLERLKDPDRPLQRAILEPKLIVRTSTRRLSE